MPMAAREPRADVSDAMDGPNCWMAKPKSSAKKVISAEKNTGWPTSSCISVGMMA